MRKFISVFFLVYFIFALSAQAKQTIYVAVLQTQSYVVGAANAPTGLYRYESDSTWRHLGWRNARNFAISVAPSIPEYIFLACGNGAMRSLDEGKSWRITTDWRVTEVLDVAISPLASEMVYLATAYGVWHTTDRGETWTVANNGLKPAFVQTIEVDRRRKDRIFAGGEGGLFVSSDGAKLWRPIGPPHISLCDLQQCASAPNLWIAGLEDHGVIISEDDGEEWRFSKGPISDQTIYAVAVDPFDPERMAAGGYQSGIFISADGGNKWTQFKKGLPSLDIHALAFDLENSGRLWAGTLGAGVYYSDDSGRTWTGAGLRGADVWDLVIVKGE